MLCIGHRGAMGHAPENTILSIQKALELGTPCIEIDVYHIGNHLIVFHDERLERTTNGHGSLEQKFEYLRTLDAGGGQRIPTLEEIFETVNLQAGVNIELKGSDFARPITEFIASLRRRGWPDKLILVSSFNHDELVRIRELDKHIKIGVLIENVSIDGISFALDIGAYSVHTSMGPINQSIINDAHTHELQVFVFTVNHLEDIIRMKSLGVDGVFTDYPEKVLTNQSSKDITIGWI